MQPWFAEDGRVGGESLYCYEVYLDFPAINSHGKLNSSLGNHHFAVETYEWGAARFQVLGLKTQSPVQVEVHHVSLASLVN